MRRLCNQNGLTLAELVIGMAVMTLIMAAVFGLLSSSVKVQNYGMSQETSFNEARAAMAAISHELRYATGVTLPSANEIRYTRDGDTTRRIYAGSGADAGSILIVRSTGTEKFGKGLMQAPVFQLLTDNMVKITVKTNIPANGVTSVLTLESKVRYGPIYQ